MPHFILVMITGSFSFILEGNGSHTMAQFSWLFGHGGDQVFYGGSWVVNRDSSKVDLHEGNELDASRMHFMYDRAYGDIVLGQVKGLTLFYRLLNSISFSLLEGVTRITYHIGPRIC